MEDPNLSAGDKPSRSLAGFFLEKNPITARAHLANVVECNE